MTPTQNPDSQIWYKAILGTLSVQGVAQTTHWTPEQARDYIMGIESPQDIEPALPVIRQGTGKRQGVSNMSQRMERVRWVWEDQGQHYCITDAEKVYRLTQDKWLLIRRAPLHRRVRLVLARRCEAMARYLGQWAEWFRQ